jgi:hypothetical protein
MRIVSYDIIPWMPFCGLTPRMLKIQWIRMNLCVFVRRLDEIHRSEFVDVVASIRTKDVRETDRTFEFGSHSMSLYIEFTLTHNLVFKITSYILIFM